MTTQTLAYAQARIQSRFGQRVDENVWLRLHNIRDLGSYLQTAQQTPLRPWVLGISTTHSSHEIELTLRQKYRHHVEEVAGWMPPGWRAPLRWVRRLADLPVLQYLVAGGEPLDWMRSDPEFGDFTADDPLMRVHAMRDAGCWPLIDSWQQDGSMLPGWQKQWLRMRPKNRFYESGLRRMDRLLLEQMQQQGRQQTTPLPTDYQAFGDRLRKVFRRYAFEPAGVCAYLAIVAVDLHRLRSDLMQRLFFVDASGLPGDLPL